MAVRIPLKLDGSNLIEMDSADISSIKAEMLRLYTINPGVTLSVSASGGNLPALTDTRYEAGDLLTYLSNAGPDESLTAEPELLSITYQTLTQSAGGVTSLVDSNNIAFPVYQIDGNIYAMSLQDMADTFVDGVINTLTEANSTPQQGGTYSVSTADSVGGMALVSGTPIFTDTQADLTIFNTFTTPLSDGSTDYPTTINNYYLHIINGPSASGFASPVQVTLDGNVKQYDSSSVQNMLQSVIQYYTSSVAGYQIQYNLETSSTGARGTGIVNTALTGVAGRYTQDDVGEASYLAQEFPDGTPAAITTHYLTCLRV